MTIVCSTVILLLLAVNTPYPISSVNNSDEMGRPGGGGVPPPRKTSYRGTTACSVKGALKLSYSYVFWIISYQK